MGVLCPGDSEVQQYRGGENRYGTWRRSALSISPGIWFWTTNGDRSPWGGGRIGEKSKRLGASFGRVYFHGARDRCNAASNGIRSCSHRKRRCVDETIRGFRNT